MYVSIVMILLTILRVAIGESLAGGPGRPANTAQQHLPYSDPYWYSVILHNVSNYSTTTCSL